MRKNEGAHQRHMEGGATLQHPIALLLSPQAGPFERYLDICDDVHVCDTSGNTLLHWAAAVGNFSAALALLQRGVDVDARNAYGATPLVVVAALCPNVATMGFLLLSHGASLHEDAGGSLGIQSLLEERGLSHVWQWLVDAERGQRSDSDAQLSSFHGCSELPAGDDTVAGLLCSPQNLDRLRSAIAHPAARKTGAASSPVTASSSAAATAIAVPRPPPRDYPAARRPADTPETPAQTAVVATRGHVSENEAAAVAHALLLQVELLLSQESTARLQVEKMQVEAFLDLYAYTTVLLENWYDEDVGEQLQEEMDKDDSWWGVGGNLLLEDRSQSNGNSGDDLVGFIESVLGERIDSDGRHHLLVQYCSPSARDGHGETWQLADAVRADPVVRAHLARSYSGNVSLDTNEAKTPSIMTLANGGSPLETWEREQLEAQLRLLPRRFLQGHEGGFLASPNGSAARSDASPIMSNFVFSEQHMPRSSGGSATIRHSTSANGYEALSLNGDPHHPQQQQQRASWRFASEHPRQFDALMSEGESREEADPASRQLLLGDRWSTQNELAHVLLGETHSSTHTAAPSRQTRTPSSVKHTGGTASDFSNDTLGSVSPALSNAPTRAPTTYSSSTGNALSVREMNTRLTASQKMDYDNFLYGSALRVLDLQRNRRRTGKGREQP